MQSAVRCAVPTWRSPFGLLSPFGIRGRRSATLAVGLLVGLLPYAAHARAIPTKGDTMSVGGFVLAGLEHLLLGWEYWLFVGCVLLVADGRRRAVQLMVLYGVAHSLTLLTAAGFGTYSSPLVVRSLIALSLTVVAAVFLAWTPLPFVTLAITVFLLGLIHGLGMADGFIEFGPPESALVAKAMAFNVGVELGLVAMAVGLVAAAYAVERIAWWIAFGPAPATVIRVALVALAIAGTVGGLTVGLSSPETAAPGRATKLIVPDSSPCRLEETPSQLPLDVELPPHTFFEPEEAAPLGGFGHGVSDGYLVVLYPRTLPETEIAPIREMVTDSPVRMMAGATKDPGFSIVTARETMTCESWDATIVNAFVDEWFDIVGPGS